MNMKDKLRRNIEEIDTWLETIDLDPDMRKILKSIRKSYKKALEMEGENG